MSGRMMLPEPPTHAITWHVSCPVHQLPGRQRFRESNDACIAARSCGLQAALCEYRQAAGQTVHCRCGIANAYLLTPAQVAPRARRRRELAAGELRPLPSAPLQLRDSSLVTAAKPKGKEGLGAVPEYSIEVPWYLYELRVTSTLCCTYNLGRCVLRNS